MADIPDWLGGVGQAIEAGFVAWGVWFARNELKSYLAQRHLGHEEVRATAAADVWDTVVRAVDVIQSQANLPIKPGSNDFVSKQVEAWGGRSVDAVEGLNRSLGRSVLLLGDTQIYDDIMMLAQMLNDLAGKSIDLRFPPSRVLAFPKEEFAMATEEQKAKALATQATILRKLNAVALRQLPAPGQ